MAFLTRPYSSSNRIINGTQKKPRILLLKINKNLRRLWPFFMILLTMSFSLHAQWKRDWSGNWLFGISGGYADRVGTVESELTYFNQIFILDSPVTLRVPTSLVSTASDLGWIYSIFSGYQKTYQRWLLGLELNIDWHHIDEDHTIAFTDSIQLLGWEESYRYKRRIMAGLSGRLGYAIADYFMPYARLGVEIGRDKFHSTFAINPSVGEFDLALQGKQWIYRFLLGAGAEIPIPCSSMSLRLEYNYHSKGKTMALSGFLFDELEIIGPLVMCSSRTQPRTQSVRLAWVWNFF
jgi:opacity protein-like surface antigen